MLSPETIRLMAQTYEEWMQDPSALSRPLETMKWAYQQICAGEDPWTGLGSFSHAWYSSCDKMHPVNHTRLIPIIVLNEKGGSRPCTRMP